MRTATVQANPYLNSYDTGHFFITKNIRALMNLLETLKMPQVILNNHSSIIQNPSIFPVSLLSSSIPGLVARKPYKIHKS
jgi:hypothetical protein